MLFGVIGFPASTSPRAWCKKSTVNSVHHFALNGRSVRIGHFDRCLELVSRLESSDQPGFGSESKGFLPQTRIHEDNSKLFGGGFHIRAIRAKLYGVTMSANRTQTKIHFCARFQSKPLQAPEAASRSSQTNQVLTPSSGAAAHPYWNHGGIVRRDGSSLYYVPVSGDLCGKRLVTLRKCAAHWERRRGV